MMRRHEHQRSDWSAENFIQDQNQVAFDSILDFITKRPEDRAPS